jgi:uncharacterized RDD family membrane protein YckC
LIATAEVAGLARRLAASVYESLLAGMLAVVTGFILLPLTEPARPSGALHLSLPTMPARITLLAAVLAVAGVYFVVLWSNGRRTLPMQTWHLRLCVASGGPPGMRRSLIRYAAWWIGPALALLGYVALRPTGHPGWSLLLLGLPYAWAFADPDRQFLHDRIAGTRLLRG